MVTIISYHLPYFIIENLDVLSVLAINLTVETASKEFKKLGCTPLFTTYRKNTIPLHVKCPNGHDWFVTLNNLQKKGIHCPECSGVVTHHTFEFVKKFFESQKYTLISNKFINANSLLSVLCPKNHSWSIRFSDFYNTGYRCPHCSERGTSAAEKELRGFIKDVYPNVYRLQDRKVKIDSKPYIKGFHIDIFIPELKRGIEFDGTYHHSVKGLKRGRPFWSEYDLLNHSNIKDDWFASKGIQILHIKEEDWNVDKENCIKKCLEFLGVK